MNDSANTIFQIAEEMVCGSHASIFLTGKAGTGKTTFLRHIKNACGKNLAVVAPTGVAAINAGGTTIHSFFQLPFGPFDYRNTSVFFGRLKINTERRQVFRQLELLIIDEISMVRADLLDAIDVVLRHFRFRPHEPFGGVQVLMIGDLYQLSPVVKDDEWRLISANYPSHYFFDSRVLRQSPPVNIAFEKIYRQQDPQFVQLLNEVRNNELGADGINILRSLYQPGFAPTEDYIILTTHNAKADAINEQKLRALETKERSFKARIDGEFNERSFPADPELKLKEGAHVMFIKNDVEKVRRYFNGKMGIVTRIGDDKIWVSCAGDADEIEVGIETWENIRYGINATTQELDEDVLGTFKQFPLRLAWAVTIHKSQGLTFDKVIIDAGAAFAPGQVYVALSRCTRLDGIVLLSEIPVSRLANDRRIVEFSQKDNSHDHLRELLLQARINYQQKILLDVFDFAALLNDAQSFAENIHKSISSFNEDLDAALIELVRLYGQLKDVGDRFCNYMRARFQSDVLPRDNIELQAKLMAAVVHFHNELGLLSQYFQNIKAVTDSRVHAKEYNELYKGLFLQTSYKQHLILAFTEGFALEKYYSAKKSFKAPVVQVNAYATASTTQTKPSPHPQLFQQLKKLRDEICDRNNIPVFVVASGKTLVELVEYLPLSKTDLQKISGFGKITIEKYGDQFLEVIKQYCKDKNLQSNIKAKAPEPKEKKEKRSSKKEPTFKQTLEYFKEGRTIAEIAQLRSLASSTIESHLAAAVATGELDPLQFIEKEKIDQVLVFASTINDEGLTAARKKLGEGFSYFDIKLAWEYYKRKTGSSGLPA